MKMKKQLKTYPKNKDDFFNQYNGKARFLIHIFTCVLSVTLVGKSRSEHITVLSLVIDTLCYIYLLYFSLMIFVQCATMLQTLIVGEIIPDYSNIFLLRDTEELRKRLLKLRQKILFHLTKILK